MFLQNKTKYPCSITVCETHPATRRTECLHPSTLQSNLPVIHGQAPRLRVDGIVWCDQGRSTHRSENFLVTLPRLELGQGMKHSLVMSQARYQFLQSAINLAV